MSPATDTYQRDEVVREHEGSDQQAPAKVTNYGCIYGHLKVEDGILYRMMADGTTETVHLWHCSRCGAGVRQAVTTGDGGGGGGTCNTVGAAVAGLLISMGAVTGWLGHMVWRAIAGLLLVVVMVRGLNAADQVPPWVMRGLLHVETSSYYDGGRIVYVNQRRGRAGEVGAFQATPATLRLYGFSPSLFEQDTVYAEAVTRAILSRYRQITGTWFGAVAAWNCGLAGRERARAIRYATQVSIAGGEG